MTADVSKNSGVSVIVPVYNGEQTLGELAKRLNEVLAPTRFEVVFVNDGSRDGSWNVICELGRQYKWIRGINLARNYGQHNALLCGIRSAALETIVTMDDDLQNPPEEIPKLIELLEKGNDVVYGTPEKEKFGFWRRFATMTAKIVLQNAMGAENARNISAFRAFRRDIRQAFAEYRGAFVNIDVLLTWGTDCFAHVRVKHEERRIGKSNYTLGKLIMHTINMVTGFSTIPLQLTSFLGFGLTIFGLGILAYVIGTYIIHGSPVPGFPFLASIISIFSGAQLFALGIIGEYLARTYFRTIDRPAYVIRQRSDSKPATQMSQEGDTN